MFLSIVSKNRNYNETHNQKAIAGISWTHNEESNKNANNENLILTRHTEVNISRDMRRWQNKNGKGTKNNRNRKLWTDMKANV